MQKSYGRAAWRRYTSTAIFSLLRGVESLDWLIAWAGRAGYSAVALADVNGMYGVVPFYQAAKAAGIKPILGVELNVECGIRNAEPKASGVRHQASAIPNSEFHIPNSAQRLTLLARNREGYRNLCRLTSLLKLEPQRFDMVEDVVRNCEGLFVLCDQPGLLKPLAHRLPAGVLYAELAPGKSPATRAKLRATYAAASELGVPVVAALDSYFAGEEEISNIKYQISNIKLEDARLAATRSPDEVGGAGLSASRKGDFCNLHFPHFLHRIVTDIRLGTADHPPRDDDYQSPDRHHWSAADMREFFARCPDALANARPHRRAVRRRYSRTGTVPLPSQQDADRRDQLLVPAQAVPSRPAAAISPGPARGGHAAGPTSWR